MVQMHPVNSSNVHSVGYDSINKNVYVAFLNGSEYLYYRVSESEFLALKGANSVGSYLDKYFKHGRYSYAQIK